MIGFFFVKQKTAYEMRISDWSSDVCSSDLQGEYEMTIGALHVARTGLDAQGFRMQVIANNLANVNTTGFKRDRASFETLSYQLMTQAGATSTAENRYAPGPNLGPGVPLNGTARTETQKNEERRVGKRG